jgi:hypothetical protein
MNAYHPDYGLPDDLRLAAVRSAEQVGVPRAAEMHRVSVVSIYRWRKVLGPRAEEQVP